METVVRAKKMYEAMFLVDSADAAGDWDGVLAAVKNVLQRAEADVLSLKKWDERKLAYDINGKSRGTYILAYFKADGGKIGGIERDVQLSDRIMRVIVLKGDHVTPEEIEKPTPIQRAEQGLPAPAPVVEPVETPKAMPAPFEEPPLTQGEEKAGE